MMIGLADGRRRSWLFVVLLVLVLIRGGWWVIDCGCLAGWGIGRRKWTPYEIRNGISAAVACKIAGYLATSKYAGEKILVLVEEKGRADPKNLAFVQSLLANGYSAERIVFDIVKKAGLYDEWPMLKMAGVDIIGRVVRRYPDIKIIILLFDIPIDTLPNFILRREPRQYIAAGPGSNRETIEYGLRYGNILAAVLPKTDAVLDVEALPDDPEEIFALRYQFLTKANAAPMP